MASNGYSSLTPGPEAGWLGYYSLNKQGKLTDTSLEALIAQNSEAGLVWTDPEADTYICGHRGHFVTSCGLTFSHVINTFLSGGHYSGAGMGPGIM